MSFLVFLFFKVFRLTSVTFKESVMMNLALKSCTSFLVFWIVLLSIEICEGASHHHGSSSSSDKVKGKKPHIVIMMADDLVNYTNFYHFFQIHEQYEIIDNFL